MQVQRKFVIWLLLLVFLFTEACTKKKPPLPPQAQAPTIAEALPEEIAETPEPALPPAQAKEQPPPLPKKPAKKPPKTTATTKKSNPPATTASTTPLPSATPPPQQQNNPTVASVRPHTAPGSESAPASAPAPELAVAAAIPSKEANKQKEDTAHMVDATENALKNLTRQLSDDEKSMRTQIQSYIQQSRKATTDGDYERAYNLAKKAQVLADALVKQ